MVPILSILAIIFAIMQRRRYKNGIATAGLVIGIIGVAISIIVAIIYIIIIATYFAPAPV